MVQRTPVLVVGAGVAGAVLALVLARHRVPTIVIERSTHDPRDPDLLPVGRHGQELLLRLGLSGPGLSGPGLSRLGRPGPMSPDRPAEIAWCRAFGRPPVIVSQRAGRLVSVAELGA